MRTPDPDGPRSHRRCRPLLGTFVEVAVAEEHAAAVDAAFAAIMRVGAVMSFHDDRSDLGRLRRASAGETVRVDRHTVEVLRTAEMLYRRTGGLFDVTVGLALVRDGFLPRPAGLDPREFEIGADALEIVSDDEVRCLSPRLIDLGGIAKGYAVDQAVAALVQAGVDQALVNAGGDLRVLGHEPQPVHLRAADGTLAGLAMLADMAMASSSNLLDRRAVHGGVAVPHRGRGAAPAPSDEAVTVVAPTCMLADALTKIALVDRALAASMLQEYGGAMIDHAALDQAA